MALPTDEEVTAYLRLDTLVEAALITAINASARAVVTQYLRTPLDLESRVFAGRYARRGIRREPQEQLTIPVRPCSTSASITDVYGRTVASDTYTIEARTGYVNAVPFTSFDWAPYTIDTTVGLGADPRYQDDVEPILRQAILHISSDFYNRRNSGAVYEQSGGQVSVTYTTDQMPPVIRLELDLLRPRGQQF